VQNWDLSDCRAHSIARYESYEGRLSGSLDARITISFRVARSEIVRHGFMYRPRQIVDYSIVSPFLLASHFIPADRTRARGKYVCSASVNPVVHFPLASNRILAGCFLDGMRFRVPRDSYFFKQFFIRLFQHDFVVFPTLVRSKQRSRCLLRIASVSYQEENEVFCSFMFQSFFRLQGKCNILRIIWKKL